MLVKFGAPGDYGISELMSMEEQLGRLFGRHVDLVERRLIEASLNWVRRRGILESARMVYAAA